MKALILSQLNPVKTLKQLAFDRALYRRLMVTALVVTAFF
jgi:hypothetical protein